MNTSERLSLWVIILMAATMSVSCNMNKAVEDDTIPLDEWEMVAISENGLDWEEVTQSRKYLFASDSDLMTMKDFIKEHCDEINQFVHPTYPVKYKQDGSLYMGLVKAIECNPDFGEVLAGIADSLSREQVVSYYREDLYKGFIATLLWGGFHKDRNTMRRFGGVVKMDRGLIVRKLERVKDLLAKGLVIEATESMLNGENEIVGIKMSYISKVLYFLAYDMNIDNKPIIFDRFLMNSHCALLDCTGPFFPYCCDNNGNLVVGDQYSLGAVYDNYIHIMHQTAEECGIGRVDNLEAWLFGWPLNQTGTGVNPRQVAMQKSMRNVLFLYDSLLRTD